LQDILSVPGHRCPHIQEKEFHGDSACTDSFSINFLFREYFFLEQVKASSTLYAIRSIINDRNICN